MASITIILTLSLLVVPAFASTVVPTIVSALNRMHVNPAVKLLDPSFSPNGPVGGVPFCVSGSLGTILCYTPSFLKKAYNFPSGVDGTGSTIAIVDAFGSPTIQSDLNKFDTTFGLPAATVTVLCGPTWTGALTDNCPVKTVGDLSTAPNAALCGAVGWAEETTLDVTMSHGLAPGAKIVLVVVNDCFDSNFNAAELAVAQQHSLRGSIMSQSFGEPDSLVGCSTFPCTTVDPTIKANADKAYAIATANHWTIVTSSGDDGANEALSATGGADLELTPSWPSTNPLNLAVGGTQGSPYGGQYGPPPGPGGTFSCAANTNCNTGLVVINGGPNGCTTAARPGVPSSCIPVGYGGEATWNEFDSIGIRTASGGGVSSLYSRPFYQFGLPSTFPTVLGSSVNANGRLTPDVSFNAAVVGGFLAYLGFLGRWAVFGGTSASAPAWAGIIALINQKVGQPVGFITPLIYLIGHIRPLYQYVFHDITSGNNSDTNGQFGVDGFAASKGYDLATGWGTPNVSHLLQLFGAFGGGQ